MSCDTETGVTCGPSRELAFSCLLRRTCVSVFPTTTGLSDGLDLKLVKLDLGLLVLVMVLVMVLAMEQVLDRRDHDQYGKRTLFPTFFHLQFWNIRR